MKGLTLEWVCLGMNKTCSQHLCVLLVGLHRPGIDQWVGVRRQHVKVVLVPPLLGAGALEDVLAQRFLVAHPLDKLVLEAVQLFQDAGTLGQNPPGPGQIVAGPPVVLQHPLGLPEAKERLGVIPLNVEHLPAGGAGPLTPLQL